MTLEIGNETAKMSILLLMISNNISHFLKEMKLEQIEHKIHAIPITES